MRVNQPYPWYEEPNGPARYAFAAQVTTGAVRALALAGFNHREIAYAFLEVGYAMAARDLYPDSSGPSPELLNAAHADVLERISEVADFLTRNLESESDAEPA